MQDTDFFSILACDQISGARLKIWVVFWKPNKEPSNKKAKSWSRKAKQVWFIEIPFELFMAKIHQLR